MKNDAYYHGYEDAKYGFTYVSDDVKAYEAGFKAYLDEQKKQNVKRLKSFEHGDAFITLESNEGKYIVSLYANGQAKQELNAIPDNTFESTCLDAALEIYHKTCQRDDQTIRD